MTMDVLDRIILGYCHLGIAGLSKWAPGTCGTFLALLVAPWLFQPLDLKWRIVVLLAVFVTGSLAATRAETILGKKDPGEVVIDELAGAWIAILPFQGGSFVLLACAFVLFRFFDILKPWPIHASENWLPDGWGVMIDDVVGGVMTMLVLLLCRYFGLLKASLL